MKPDKYGYLYLINTIFLFSTYEVVSKTIVGKVDSFQINFIRFMVGGIILFTFLMLKKDYKISKSDFLWVSVIGIINVVVSMNLVQLALYVSDARASIVAVIFSSNPIFVCIFAALIEGEKLDSAKIIGLLSGVVGIVVIFLEKLDISTLDFKSPLLALSSAVFYGLYTVLGRKVSVRIGSLKMNSYSFIIGSMVLFPVLLFMEKPVLSFDHSGMLQVIYLSVFVTGIAYLTYFKGLSIMGASKGSLVFFVKPVLASMIAIIFLGEKLSTNLIFGTVLIILGIMVVVNAEKVKKFIGKVTVYTKPNDL